MKTVRLIALAAIVAFSVGGCTTFQNIANAIGQATISGSSALVVANVYDGLEITAAGYLEQPKCGKTTSAICRSPAATAQIIPAVRSGRVLRNQVELCLQSSNCPQSLTDKLSAINTTLKGVFTAYNVH